MVQHQLGLGPSPPVLKLATLPVPLSEFQNLELIVAAMDGEGLWERLNFEHPTRDIAQPSSVCQG